MSAESPKLNKGQENESIKSNIESETSKLLSGCLHLVETYGKKIEGNSEGAQYKLTNSKEIYISDKPFGEKLKPGEILIGRYDEAGDPIDFITVKNLDEAKKEIEEWAENKLN